LQGATQKNYIFFSLIASNLERAVCRFQCYLGNRGWMLEKSQYRILNGKLERLGRFKDNVVHNSILSFFIDSALLRYFEINITPYLFPSDREILVKMFTVLKQRYETLAPNSEFIVVFSPWGYGALLRQLAPDLSHAGIQVWDFTSYQLDKIVAPVPVILPLDNHPNPEGHFAYALLLEKKMKEEGILP
jgi:hypothetical protein